MLTDFHIKHKDTRDIIAMQLEYADGSTINSDITGASIYFNMMRASDSTILINRAPGLILDVPNKIVGFQWRAGDTDTVSTAAAPHLAEFEVVFPDGTVQSFPNSPVSGTLPFINIHIWQDIA